MTRMAETLYSYLVFSIPEMPVILGTSTSAVPYNKRMICFAFR